MKVIIVEDEFLAQQELSWLIKEHSQMEIVGTFDDGLDAHVSLFAQPVRRKMPVILACLQYSANVLPEHKLSPGQVYQAISHHRCHHLQYRQHAANHHGGRHTPGDAKHPEQ